MGKYVYVRLIRPEWYEETHPDLVIEDAGIHPAFEPEAVADFDTMIQEAEKRGMLKAADKCFGRRWMVLQPLRTYTADECTRAQREAVESVGRELRQAAERSADNANVKGAAQ